MQDLDKQLEGMKQDLTGVQVWNPDSTSYYQADGADPYAYACGKEHKADSFFNATGDAADLKIKWDEAKAKTGKVQDQLTYVTAQIIPLKTKRDYWQGLYDKLNAVKKKSAGQEKDLRNYGSEYTNAERDVRAVQDSINLYTGNLAAAKVVEGAAKSAYETQFNVENTKTTTEAQIKNDADLVAKGIDPVAQRIKAEVEAKSGTRPKLFLIGGIVLLAGIFGVMFLRKRA